MSTQFIVRYDPSVSPHTGSAESYKLLEISPELAKVVEQAGKEGEEGVILTMKGAPADDAVICTPSQTFALRTITVSNSMLFLRPPQSGLPSTTTSSSSSSSEPTTSHPASQLPEQTLLIQDTCHEILELTPTVPRLDRLERLLRDTAWTGMPGFGNNRNKNRGGVSRGVKRSLHDDGDDNDDNDHAIIAKKRRSRRYTRAQLQSLVQASDQELDEGLKARNVIQVDGDHLMHLPTRHLLPLLSTLLSLLTIHAINPTTLPRSITTNTTRRVPTPSNDDASAASAAAETRYAQAYPIAQDLSNDFSVSQDVAEGVMGVFGDLVRVGEDAAVAAEAKAEGGVATTTLDQSTVWRVQLSRLVNEVGKGLLSLESTLDPPTVDDFMARWGEQVGPGYEHLLKLDRLEGEYLLQHPSPAAAAAASSLSTTRSPLLIPFSVSSLPTEPAQRFSDLFATRSQWRPENMQPFLKGLTPVGDRKALDKLVVKYVRVVKGSGKKGGASEVWWHARR